MLIFVSVLAIFVHQVKLDENEKVSLNYLK